MLNFKASENYQKTPNAYAIEFPNVPLRPAFAYGSSLITPHLLLLTPQRPVNRRLNFDESQYTEPISVTPEKQPQPEAPPFQRTSLSLAMLFGQTAHHKLSGFDAPAQVKQKPNFLLGPRASAWIEFKLDLTAMLVPWVGRNSFGDDD